MIDTYKYIGIAAGTFIILTASTLGLSVKANGVYSRHTICMQSRTALIQNVHLAAPVLATAGRNIAFETGNAVSNAPASYLTMLDCCESDEAIADRIAVAKTTSRLIKRGRHN